MAKTIGIVAHSAEGGGLCFLSACRYGAEELGAHMHPEIVMSAIPMGASMPAWEAEDFEAVAPHLARGVEVVAAAGADVFVCPDNTAHLVLESIVDQLPIPGLHIVDAVCQEIARHGWTQVGLLGTRWTMTGEVYARALASRGLTRVLPEASTRERINAAIFEELCQGRFLPETTAMFVRAVAELADAGAQCVVLGCTEIPLILNDENASLPVLDSTRLLARAAVREALHGPERPARGGWIDL